MADYNDGELGEASRHLELLLSQRAELTPCFLVVERIAQNAKSIKRHVSGMLSISCLCRGLCLCHCLCLCLCMLMHKNALCSCTSNDVIGGHKHMEMHTYIPTCIHTYSCTYIHTYIFVTRTRQSQARFLSNQQHTSHLDAFIHTYIHEKINKGGNQYT